MHAMVIRKRIRAVLYPLTLYACCGLASGAFIWTAVHGERGLQTKTEYKRQITGLRTQLAALSAERMQWEHRISLMRSEAIDADMLHEQARSTLGYVDPRDLVVFLKKPARS